MQASMVTYMASNCAEPTAEAVPSGQGLRVNSALQAQTTDTLFTSLLQQGINGMPGTPLVLNGGDIQLIMTEDGKKTGEDESVDVCSLLMQLMVMNSGSQSEGNSDGQNSSPEQAVNGILGVIGEISETTGETAMKGLDQAATVILQNDGKAAEILSALAASKSNAAVNDGQPKGETSATAANTVLAGITEALNSELQQNGTDAQAAGVGDESDGSKAAGQPVLTAGAVTAAGQAGSGSTADGSNAGDHADSGFGEIMSLEKNRNDEAGIAASGANQVLAGTDFKGETMAEKTSAVERALNSFTDDLRSLRGGNQEIRIVLEPESLGVLVISVIKTESGISAKIKSEDKEVAAIISEHLQKLITSIQSKGITVDDVDVVYSQAEQNTSFSQPSFSQAREESSRGYTLPGEKNPDADTPTHDLWQNYFGGETSGDTTVDYRV